MELIAHRHLSTSGYLQTHMRVYTCAAAAPLAALVDLGRIAALGAIFYLLMDMGIHWGLLRHLRGEVDAKPAILIAAMALDVLLLGAFLWVKAGQEPIILVWTAGGVAAIFLLEWQLLRVHRFSDGEDPNYQAPSGPMRAATTPRTGRAVDDGPIPQSALHNGCMRGRLMNLLVAATWLPEVNVFIFAILLNFPWEFLQVPMFDRMPDAPHWEAVKTCTRAALGDAVIMLSAYGVVAVIAGTRRWIVAPGRAETLGFVAIGLSITLVLERLVLEDLWVSKWSYSSSMPVIPWLEVGVTPVLQWLLLPPLVVWFVRRQLGPDRTGGR